MSRVLAAFEEHCPHADLPRTLAPKLRRAGFTLRTQSVVTQFNPVCDPDTYSHHLIRLIRSFVVDRKGVTAEEADQWASELRELDERGEYFFCLNQYLMVATKPS
jgi:hypothetical protein